MITEYRYLKKYNIHEINKNMIYVLSNLGYQGFIYGKCSLSCHAEEYIDELVDSLDFLMKENKKPFLYHPLILSEKNTDLSNNYSYNNNYNYSLLFLFCESTPVEIMEKTFLYLDEFLKIHENKYSFNKIRVLKEDSYTQLFDSYIEPEYASYIKMLMSMINGTYEETRLEEYKEALENKKNIPMYLEEKNRLEKLIHDFFSNKTFAKYAIMQKKIGVLSEDADFTDKLILLQRHNFCHYRNHPLNFDLSVFDNKNEKELSYRENMSTLNRINNVSKATEIIPYAATALYETESGEEVISQIECSFDINSDYLIPRFWVIEYAYGKNDVKFQRNLDIDAMNYISNYDLKYIYKYFILHIIMKMSYTAKKYGLTMKKFKAFSYDYDLLFNVHSNNSAYLCQKPIRKKNWKTSQAELFHTMFKSISKIGEIYFDKKNRISKLNEIHEREWKKAKENYEESLKVKERFRLARLAEDERRAKELKKFKSGWQWSVWTPFFTESDYEDYLVEKEIAKAYKICENYRKKHGID